ncbi:MAG: hypothetical protein KBA40_00250 [Candidatus Peribacteraceae bacterium]|nr:hypothetical protein [Candidatus Peribacteraceae bacterium]
MKQRLAIVAAAFLLAVIPQVADAQLWIYCGDLPGCPSGFTERVSAFMVLLLTRLPNYVYMLGVLFIMIGGVYMVISAGDTEKVTKGKNTIIWAIIGIFVMQFADTAVNLVIVPEAQSTLGGADLVSSLVKTIIDDILILIYIVLLIVAVISGMRMVLAFGKDEEFTKGRDGLLWAAIGAIIINLAQAIANVFCLANPSVCFLN